jgi:hypothetical protein
MAGCAQVKVPRRLKTNNPLRPPTEAKIAEGVKSVLYLKGNPCLKKNFLAAPQALRVSTSASAKSTALPLRKA